MTEHVLEYSEEKDAYVDDKGRTSEEIVGDGEIESVQYIGNRELLTVVDSGGSDEKEYDYSYDEESEEYECNADDCDYTHEKESMVKRHYTINHSNE